MIKWFKHQVLKLQCIRIQVFHFHLPLGYIYISYIVDYL